MIFLRSIALRGKVDAATGYPFTVPVIASFDRLDFESPVTFFAGENGTGKSTLIEAIASGANSISVRADDRQTENTLMHAGDLAANLRFQWTKRSRRGFFLRAEDFFDYTKRVAGLVDEMAGYASDFESRLDGYALDLAKGAVLGERQALVRRYDGDLNSRSHGESFLQFFGARFVNPGLYLLDEPDTALSPQSVLALLSMLKSMVADGSQFIIATHSPMLMAFPGATIYSFDTAPITAVRYEDVEQIGLMRRFLQEPDAFLRRL